LAAEADAMKQFLAQFFTWWSGQTLGTRFYTWRKGEFVGEDEFGNRYYRHVQAQAIDSNVGAERRWVVYNGESDASKVPPGWRAWLCHNGDVPPSEETYKPHPWEKPYVPNMTGTPQAYRPSGSQLSTGQRPAATGDYVPWTPGE
jgi:NADH:ubiquinone oxidoreductase subunit